MDECRTDIVVAHGLMRSALARLVRGGAERASNDLRLALDTLDDEYPAGNELDDEQLTALIEAIPLR